MGFFYEKKELRKYGIIKEKRCKGDENLNQFAHLKIQSQYNFNSAVKIEELIQLCKEHEMKAVALTDIHTLHHAAHFVGCAKEEGIKAIIGCQFTIRDELKKEDSTITLLAKNQNGYHAISKLSYLSLQRGKDLFITKGEFAKYTEDVVLLTGGSNGYIVQQIMNNKLKEADENLRELRAILPAEDIYFEVQDYGLSYQHQLNQLLKQISNHFGFKLVATNDVRYLKKEQAFQAEILDALHVGRSIEHLAHSENYFKTTQEMETLFINIPESITNTLEIVEKCNVNFPTKGDESFQRKVPEFSVPETFRIPPNLPDYIEHPKGFVLPTDEKKRRSIGFLVALAFQGLQRYYGTQRIDAIKRVRYELGIIISKDYTDYILLIYDLVQFARNNNIPLSPGRGSAAGSLVLRCLDVIRGICPIEHDLLFERFLNPDREDDVDVDLDFSADKRPLVIEYMKKKYGSDCVAQILTFDNYGLRSGFQAIARSLGIPQNVIDKVSKCIPKDAETLSDVLKSEKAVEEKMNQIVERNEYIAQALHQMFLIQGYPQNLSKHAAGIIVGKNPLIEEMPMFMSRHADTGENILLTQIPNNDGGLEKIGFPKIDVLALRNVDVWHETKQEVQKATGFDAENIPLNDPKTMELFQTGDLVGVFQMHSPSMRQASLTIQPQNLNDISAVSALNRPGPMEYIPNYATNKQNGQIVIPGTDQNVAQLEDLRPILKNTHGILVYQEQIMRLANVWAGYKLGEADVLRRAVSKKKKEVLEKERIEFVKRSIENGRDSETSHAIYDLIVRFADYGFNKSHAVIYSLLSYETAYLKAHFPVIYMAVLMSSVISGKKKSIPTAAKYYQEAVRMGINIEMPNINQSTALFTADGATIHFGLMMVKNVGRQAAEDIERERKENGMFTSFESFIHRMEKSAVDKNAKLSLIKVGAFDQFGTRKKLISMVETDTILPDRIHIKQMEFSDIPGIEPDTKTDVHEEEYTISDLLSFETDLLCMSLSNPLLSYEEEIQTMLKKIEPKRRAKELFLPAFIVKVKEKKDRNKNDMAAITALVNGKEEEFVVFQQSWQRLKEQIKPNNVLMITTKEKENPKFSYAIDHVRPIKRTQSVTIDITQHVRKLTESERNTWMKHLLKLCLAERGETPVFIKLQNEVRSLDIKYHVSVTESFLQSVHAYTSKEDVIVKRFN